MTILQDILAALNWQVRVNENFSAVSPAALFSKKHSTTTGLTLGYYGGILDGVSYADGTHLLTASTTRYVVVARATGVVSSSTGTTNWNDAANYLRMGVTVVGASTITSWTDWRQVVGGSGGGGGSFTGGTLTSALNEAPTVTVASSATPAIGAAAGNSISITGTTTITGFDSIAAGAIRRLIFAGSLTLTHNGTSLILPTGSNITTAGGDVAELISLGSGNWRVLNYSRASGAALVGSTAGLAWNSQTASYTLAIGDANNGVEMLVATANNLTVPLNATVAFPVGTSILVYQAGAGLTTIVATGGVTIVKRGSSLALGGQYSLATLVKRATDTWILSGDIAP
ncbi:hypothetical protein [Variovorax boronicumulans]|uniref:hypothetical protein n=1 Tax=Variovorax boronicumulans TaxID=436515 RepID=UPI0012E57318|nr:hypothetical protein [Variovorax boronicumulans]GER21448.1 hypothetical protein VCH24_65000 [Variovorax boronicumulans]